MSERKKQQSSYTIYIACEGAVSEKEYFEAIRDEVQQQWNVYVDVYPKNAQSANDAMSLVNLAHKNAIKFKEVWAVFDKDGDVPTAALDEATKVKNGKIVNIGYSSIAFEHWILLHFEKNNNAFLKSDCKEKATGDHFYCGQPGSTHAEDCKGVRCAANRVREKYIADYNKKGGFNLYSKIKHQNERVLENAAWLRYKMGVDMEAVKHAATNPYTNLDALLRKLYNNTEKIFWGNLNQNYSNGDIDISVSYSSPLITVTLINNGASRFFFTQNNNEYFFLSNDEGEIGDLEFVGSEILTNESTQAEKSEKTVSLYKNDKAIIKFNSLPSIKFPPLYFNFKYNSVRNMFQIL